MIDLVVEALTLNLQYTSSLYVQPAGLAAAAAVTPRPPTQ